LGYGLKGRGRNGPAVLSGSARSGPGWLRHALEPSRSACVGPLRTLRGPQYRPEKDFDLDPFQITILKLYALVESLLTNRRFGLFKGSVLTLDDCPAHGALALFVALDASFQRHTEKYQSGRDLVLLCQVEQLLPSRSSQRRRVNHAESVRGKPLFYKEMYQLKGLCVEALVTFVIANVSARPIRRNDLSGPKVPFGKGGFPASRRAAQYNDRRPEEAD